MAAPIKYTDRSHARIYGDWESYPAWITLSPFGRSILTVFLMDYRKDQNFLKLSDREAARRGNCARATAVKAIQELQEKGWIGIARVGKMRGKRSQRACAYYLTCYPEEIGVPATYAYKKWKPENIAKNQPCKPLNSSANGGNSNGLDMSH